jgi:hypothetical protein
VVTDIADFHSYYAMPDQLEKWRKWTDKYAGRPWWLFAHEYTEHALWRKFLLDPWHGDERPLALDVQPKGDEPLLVSEFGNWGLPDVHKLYEGSGAMELFTRAVSSSASGSTTCSVSFPRWLL